MITRNQALALIQEHVENKNIIKHMVALEVVMGAIYDALQMKERPSTSSGQNSPKGNFGTKDEWMMAGLLHDGDYCEGVSENQQWIMITQWARGKGLGIPENVAHAMAAHNSDTGIKPESLMDWAIFCADSLTGLIVAATLILPTKTLACLTVQSVEKRFKEPSFARGTRRNEIAMCDEHLGISLHDFIAIALKAMQEHSEELGL